MTRLDINRIALQLHGISAEIAQAAMQGLETELLHRLQMRGIDHSALSGLSPSIRLPAIHSLTPLDADSLRARLADGLIDMLSGKNSQDSSDSDSDSSAGGNA
jgi:hypothetical protein